MEFLISRTSIKDYKYKDKSANEIVKMLNINTKKYSLSVGTYESEIKNYSKITRKGVFIEIEDIEDLLELEKDYGEIIIKTNWWNSSIKEIEIYDDYRE